MNFKFKNVLLIGLLIFIISISAVSAADNDSVVLSDSNDGESNSIVQSKLEDNVDVSQYAANDLDESVNKSHEAVVGASVGNDDGEILGYAANSFHALEYEINRTFDEGRDTLDLAQNYKYVAADDGDLIMGIRITKSITIDGHGYSIDGSSVARIFNINSANVVLKNIIFKNANIAKNTSLGTADRSGGAIKWNGNDGKVLSCTFDNNRVYGSDLGYASYGGSIYWTGNRFTVEDSTFKGPTNAYLSRSGGSGIYVQGSNVNIVGSTFDYLRSYQGPGGAIYAAGNGNSNINITGCFFLNTWDGNTRSAVYIQYKENINVSDNTFDHWYAYNGLIYLYGNQNHILISGNTFKNFNSSYHGIVQTDSRTVNDLNITNNIYKNSSVAERGMLLRDSSRAGSVIVAYNTFEDIICRSTSWGALIDFYDAFGRADVYNNTFINIASSKYGAIITYGPAYIENNTFYNCSISTTKDNVAQGIAISAYDYVYIFNNNFTVNFYNGTPNLAEGVIFISSSGSGVITNNNFTDNNITNSFSMHMGIIHNEGNNTLILNNIFRNNNCTGAYGGIVYNIGNNVLFNNNNCTDSFSANGGVIYSTGEYVNITNNNITGCYAENDAGAFYVIGKNANISNNNFTNIHANNYGVIYCDATDSILYNNYYYNNYANDKGVLAIGSGVTVDLDNLTHNWGYGFAGSVMIIGDNNTLKNIEITDTNAVSGGAIYNTGINNKLDTISITDAHASNYGGAIYSTGDNLNITKLTVHISDAGIDGGAVYNTGANSKLSQSSFDDTFASNKGGAIFWSGAYGTLSYIDIIDSHADGDGGAVYWTGTSGTINNLTVNNVYAIAGGAFYCSGLNTKLFNSSFENIRASSDGGAIYWTGSDANLTLISFKNINSSSNGGAIYGTGTDSILDDLTFEDVNATSNGGAINWAGARSRLNNLNFMYINSNSKGGALYFTGDKSSFKKGKFINVTASGDGGAIYWTGSDSNMSGINFTNCSASDMGGAIYLTGSTCALSDANFTNNSAGSGGAILWNAPNGKVCDAKFYDNIALGNGGAIYWIGNNATLNDLDLINNSATFKGGAINIIGNNATLYGLFAYKNHADVDGGAIILDGSYGSLKYSELINNTAVTNGGALNWAGVDGTLSNVSFENNTGGIGGAVYWSSDNADISDVNFTSNNASTAGALYMGGLTGGKLINGNFIDNNASTYGGAIYWSGSNGDLSYCKFINASAFDGGAIYWTGTDATLDNLTFEGVSAIANGGILYVSASNVEVFNASFYNSSARSGGAIYWTGAYGTLKNVDFNNNNASTYGGAIYWMGNNAVMDNMNLTNNTAGVDGGALYIISYGANLNNIRILNNTASNYGGGMYWAGTGDISNAVLMYNRAFSGSAIYNGGTLNILNAIILKNKANMSSFDIVKEETNIEMIITIVVRGWDNFVNGIWTTSNNIYARNITYWGADGNTTSLNTWIKPVRGISSTTLYIDTALQGIPLNATYYRGGSEVLEYSNITNVCGNYTYRDTKLPQDDYQINVIHEEDEYYTAFEGSKTITMGPIDSDLEVSLNSNEIYYDTEVEIRSKIVTVDSSGVPVGVWGKVDLYIDGKFINLTVDVEDGLSIVNTKLPKEFTVGLHNISGQFYDGKDSAGHDMGVVINCSTPFYFNIVKNFLPTVLNITTTSPTFFVDEEVNITISGPEAYVGNITYVAGNVNGTCKLVNGTYNISTVYLDNGTVNVLVYVEGDDNYLPSSAFYSFTIIKRDIGAEFENVIDGNLSTIDVGDDIVIQLDLNVTDIDGSSVVISVDGKEYVGIVDESSVAVNVTDLKEGVYNVSAKYVGNNKYNSFVTDNVSLTVNKINIDSIDVVSDISTIYVGDAVSFVITLNPAKYNVNDYVVVNIGGNNYEVSINDNVGQLTVYDLANGTYDMSVSFNGNDQFNGKSVDLDDVVTVNRINTALSIVPFNPEIYVGENALFDIYVTSDKSSVNGFVTVTLNNVEYNVSITNGAGLLNVSNLPYNENSYTASASYAGNNKFVASDNSALIRVDKRDVASVSARLINKPVYIGEDASLEIVLRSGRYPVNGFITVLVDNREFNVSVVDGVALLNVSGLAYSDDYYSVDLIFAGNDEFYGFTELGITDIIVKKVDIKEINLTSNSPINVGDEAVFNINMTSILPDEYIVNTIITVKINNKEYNVSISNNTGTLRIPDLVEGVHDIFISYRGDDLFNGFNNYSSRPISSIEVKKIPTSISMNDVTINVGNTAVIVARINDAHVTGNVTFTVDNKEYTKGIIDGVAILEVNGLNTSSNKSIVARYSGDSKFVNSSATAELTVNKVSDSPIISVYDIVAGEVECVVIALPSDVTNGTITVKFNNTVLTPQEYTINNNVIRFNRTIQTAGDYSVEIAVDNDAKYDNMADSDNFIVSKEEDYNIGVTIGDVVFGQDIEVNVVLPSDATGDVIINGETHSVEDARNGVVLPANNAAGNYTLNVTYVNDDKYANKTVLVNYTVPKSSSSVSIDIDDVFVVGEDIRFTVHAVNSKGAISVIINDKVYNPTNGTEFTINGGLANATYNVIVRLDGDSNYTSSGTSKVIYVIKDSVSIVLDDISASFKVGDEVTVTARFDKSVDGDVIFNINGSNYTVKANNANTVSYKYVPQSNGTYVVSAVYSGNDKYNANTTARSVSFAVDKILTRLVITAAPIYVGAEAVIGVEVISNEATGSVNIRINGKSYDVALTNGKGSVFISGLNNDTNNDIVAIYSGDNKYNSSMNTSSIAVSKINIKSIVVKPSDLNIYVGEDADLNITVTPNVSGYLVNDFVTVKVDNRQFNVSIINNTGFLTVSSLGEGKYGVNVSYGGSTIYNPLDKNNAMFITVNKTNVVDIKVTPEDNPVYVGDEIELNITLTSQPDKYAVNGFVTVNVSGRNYNVSVVNGKGVLKIPTLDSGDYAVGVYYNGDNAFKSLNATNVANIHVSKIPVSISVSPLNQSVFVGGEAVLNISVKCDERDYIVSGYVNASVNDRQYNVSIINGTGLLILRGLSNGTYNIGVTYNGDNVFKAADGEASLTVVNKISTSIQMGDVTINVGDIANIEAIINTTEATGNLTFIVDNKEYVVGIINGRAKLNVSNLNTSANKTISAKYSGDYKYLNSSAVAELHISKVDANATISVHNITAGEMEVIVIKLPSDITNATIKFYMDDNEITDYIINNNIISLNSTIQTYGVYTVRIDVSDDCKYNDFTNQTTFTVFKVSPDNYTIEIDVNNTSVFKEIPVIIRLPGDANETLSLFVDGDLINSTIPVTAGIAEYTLENQSYGNHTISVMYGNGKYDVKLVESNVYVAKIASNISIVNPVNPKVAHDIIIGLLPEGSTGNITVTINNKTYVVQNRESVNASDLKEGQYTVVAVLDGDENYLPSQTTSTFVVTRNNVTAQLKNISDEIHVGIPVVLHVDFDENVSGEVVFNINNMNYTVTINESMSVDYIWTPSNDGDVNIFASYSGDDVYYPTNTSAMGVSVFKNPISFNNISADDIIVGDSACIITYLNESDATGVIIVYINGTAYEGVISEGIAVVNITDLSAGVYNVTAHYAGDTKYLAANAISTSFNVNKHDTLVIVNTSDIMVLDDAVVIVSVPETATGYVYITVGNKTIYLPVVDGKVSWTISGLSAGNYTVEALYSGDYMYSSNSSSESFIVSKYDSQTIIDANDIWDDEDETIIVKVPSDATGNVSIVVNNETYTSSIENGVAVFNISNPDVGNYTVNALYGGDYKYAESSNVSEFIVKLNYPIIEAVDLTKYYGAKDRLIFNLTNARGDKLTNKTVVVNINGINYNRTTNDKGVVSMAINLLSGEYAATISYEGSSELESVTKVINVTVLSTIQSNDLTKVYRNDSQFWAYFTDSNGNPLANTTVTFNINGVMYNRVTNESGWAKLNINLPQGEYIITSYNTVTGETCSNIITVLSSIVDNNDLVKVYGNPDKFTVRIIGDDAQPVGAGAEVQFNINGVFYTRSTNDEGFASLNINLPPGEYIITSYYLGCTVSNTVIVLSKD